MPKTTSGRATTITVRVGPNTKRSIHAYAKAREMTVGEFVRYCVRIYMDHTPIDEDEETANEMAELHRQIGTGTFGPPLEVGEIRRGDDHKVLEDTLDASLRKHTGYGLDDFQKLAAD